MYTYSQCDIDQFEIYDELGNRITYSSLRWGVYDRKHPERTLAKMLIPAVGVGEHTYTIYAIDTDGNQSRDSKSITVTVR